MDPWYSLAAVATVAWGIGAGWVAAWFAHRYGEGTDADGYEVAVLGDATCPSCGHIVALAEAAPLRSMSCPDCSHRMPASWNLIPMATLVASLGMLMTFGASWVLMPFLWLVPVLVLAAAIDIRTFLIPKRVVWIGFGVGATLISVVAIAAGQPGSIIGALIGAVGYFVVLFVANLINPAGMGFGDVRLAIILGLYLGWIDLRLPLYGLLIACLAGLVLGLAKKARATTDADGAFPFGPGLAVGTFAAVWLYSTILTP